MLLQEFHLTVNKRSEDSPKSPSVCHLHNQANGVSFEGDFIMKLTLVFFCYILLCEVRDGELLQVQKGIRTMIEGFGEIPLRRPQDI